MSFRVAFRGASGENKRNFLEILLAMSLGIFTNSSRFFLRTISAFSLVAYMTLS